MSTIIPKILMFTLDYLPKKGGLSHYIYGIARELPEGKIVVLTDSSLKPEKPINVGHPIYYETLLNATSRPQWLPAFSALKRIIDKERPDLVIVPQLLPLGLVAYIICKLRGVDFYISLHGLDIFNAQITSRKRLVARFVLKRADAIITNSEYTKAETEKFLGVKRAIIIVNPCPLTTVSKTTKTKDMYRKEKGLNVDQIVLLTVGRLVKRKGVHSVIEAMPEILKKEHEVRYIIIGKGPEERRIRELIQRKRLEGSIELHTAVGDEELESYYRLSDIFIMPSMKIGPDVEGFGLVFLEANQYSLPVIGGRSGGIPEAIQDGKSGFLVDPYSIEEIKNAVLTLATDKNTREAMGKYAKKRVEEHYIWRHEVNKLIFVYNNI
jgi:phosphatidyl-myo-inositol dimannoside synthase